MASGEVDWYEQVQPDLIPQLRRGDVNIANANPTGFNGILRFNHIQPPFNNVAMRRAILTAVDQNDYMAAVTAADPTAELVQLGEPEAVGLLDDHDRRVRNVDADLDHRRRHQNLRLAA